MGAFERQCQAERAQDHTVAAAGRIKSGAEEADPAAMVRPEAPSKLPSAGAVGSGNEGCS